MLNITYNTNGKSVHITGVSSILNPRDNTVLFIARKMLDRVDALSTVKGCLIYTVLEAVVPTEAEVENIIMKSDNPRRDFGRFLEENDAEPKTSGDFSVSNGSVIAYGASIAAGVVIYPGCYIESDVKIGQNTVIHSGVRVLSGTTIGENCVIHDNVVIGSLSMAYEGSQRIPQVGGVLIGDNVHIGALSVICRGAIEDTVIESGVKIDNCCSIAHNDHVGQDSMIICGTKLFGSVSVGRGAYISGGVTVKNALTIGENSLVGLGSVVIHDVEAGQVVAGNPAKFLRMR